VYTVGPVLPGESFIVDGLARVGFNVKLLQVSIPGPNSTGPSFQLALAQWAQTYPDPQGYCTLSLRSGQPFNLGGWHNAAYDRLVDKADTTLDSKERAKLYIRAQHIALSQGALIAVDNRNSYALTKPYVHGLVGTEAFPWLVPKDGDWSNVSVDPH
jgi:ABC-type transport system substrate-binding protein